MAQNPRPKPQPKLATPAQNALNNGTGAVEGIAEETTREVVRFIPNPLVKGVVSLGLSFVFSAYAAKQFRDANIEAVKRAGDANIEAIKRAAGDNTE